jgi:hypothetical protein
MLEKLKRRIPDVKDDALLQDLLDAAAEMILAYTGRDELPPVLQAVQIELAAMQLNRMGMEGESSHAEGSVHRSADSLPEMVRRQLNPYRLARAVEM